jgi:hypothetical protein
LVSNPFQFSSYLNPYLNPFLGCGTLTLMLHYGTPEDKIPSNNFWNDVAKILSVHSSLSCVGWPLATDSAFHLRFV